MKKLILFLLVACVTSLNFAQVTTSSIGGTITNNGVPVEDAQISLVLTTTNAKYKTSTRVGGGFDIFNVQAGGPYSLTISASKSVTVDNIYRYYKYFYNLGCSNRCSLFILITEHLKQKGQLFELALCENNLMCELQL